MDKDNIGATLRKLRGGRTQEEVAKAVGISTSTLCMYETGKRIPKDEIKERLADYYKKSVKYIFYA